MKWIIFCQNPYDRVDYVTDEIYPEHESMSYKKFYTFLFEKYVDNASLLKEKLDSFQTIHLNAQTGEWEQVFPEYEKVTFEELIKLNPNEEDKKKQEEEKTNKPVIQGKKLIQDIFDRNKDLFKKKGY